MKNTVGKPFNYRAFVDDALTVCLIGLLLSATVLEAREHGRQANFGHSIWTPVHVGFGIVFVVFAVWHVVLNHRALWKYLKGTGARVTSMSVELAVAVVVVTAAMLLLVGHEFIGK